MAKYTDEEIVAYLKTLRVGDVLTADDSELGRLKRQRDELQRKIDEMEAAL